MRRRKSGLTLIELIVSLSILVILFTVVYDLYMNNLSLYKKDEMKVKSELQVKNFCDSLYSYLKASYQNSIEVGNSEKLEDVKWSEVIEEQKSILMLIPQKGDPVECSDSYIENLSGSYYYRGRLKDIINSEEVKNTDYHYIMFSLKEENGGKYIETISNIIEDSQIKTKSLKGIVENFTIKPEYVQVNENAEARLILSKIKIKLEYKQSKNKTDNIKLDYTIRN
ncbi:PilW family protein [Clostridium cylindrosporum]|uniref:Prepilin-type N-terminal cleavage/methylation domain-containing protein n=1 Tax=Clostridium cylindrosporum DSM 605 TaxID=1121307 RepID=A0A0J8G0G6_CLOCY|nr:prepilin-type N-terminal cleavage/methylation domain-containing protein [Clostridium cylindrosporum]KMT21286.1 hypothetical protein CLCY_2c00460 [Clostridium cylindrosporum DSM 605]